MCLLIMRSIVVVSVMTIVPFVEIDYDSIS